MPDQPSAIPVHVLERGVEVAALQMPISTPSDTAAKVPRVTAMMVTRGRAAQAMRAVRCLFAQTYPQTELVIVDDEPEDRLGASLSRLSAAAQQRIVHVRVAPDALPLGALRNLAVHHASGEYVCQWDDDDLYDPRRITWQMRALALAGAGACTLWRHRILWERQQRIAWSVRRVWEGSLLCRRDAIPPYPPLRRGEDTPVIDALLASTRVALLDAPWLYTYIVHGANTFEPAHFEPHWQHATVRFEGSAYRRELACVAASLPQEDARELTRGE